MDNSQSFCVVIPIRNVPAERCLELATHIAHAAKVATFSRPLKVLFLVNDGVPGFSANLDQSLAANKIPGIDVETLHSDQDYPTVEENIKNNIAREINKLPDIFLFIGSSDSIDFTVLDQALNFMKRGPIDLLLVGVNNSESWEGKIIRTSYATPPLNIFEKKNSLPMNLCMGTDVFKRTVIDYGPVDYLAYIGCQIYTKRFFLDLCRIKVREPLYSMPVGTLELTERSPYIVGFFPPVVVTRIDVLAYGPDNPTHPPNWWVTQSRVKRGLSKEISMSVVTSSLDLNMNAFTALIYSRMVSISRGDGRYVYRPYLNSMVMCFVDTLIKSQTDPSFRFAPSEVQDIGAFGAKLDNVDLRMAAGRQEKACSWLKRFPLIVNQVDVKSFQEWCQETVSVVQALGERPHDSFWFLQEAA